MKYRHLVFFMKRWISINNMWGWNNNKEYFYGLSRNMALHLWHLSELLISCLESDSWDCISLLSKYKHMSLLIQDKLWCMVFLMVVLQNFVFQWKREKDWKVRRICKTRTYLVYSLEKNKMAKLWWKKGFITLEGVLPFPWVWRRSNQILQQIELHQISFALSSAEKTEKKLIM